MQIIVQLKSTNDKVLCILPENSVYWHLDPQTGRFFDIYTTMKKQWTKLVLVLIVIINFVTKG